MTIWKNKWKILEGIWYNHIVFHFNKTHWAKKLVEERRTICSTCKYLDRYGLSERVVLKGKPACSLCGCNIQEKTACLSCECPIEDFPKWKGVKVKNDYLIEAKLDG